MTFIHPVAQDPATGLSAELFAADPRSWGYLPNFATTFGRRPEVYQAWRQLIGALPSADEVVRLVTDPDSTTLDPVVATPLRDSLTVGHPIAGLT